ncbi:lipocalin family protein [Luteibacter yeojuensis]|uniref:Outer membrane lipoprotein Blc n=1 Tax=Luteibacter yeojuensis TaxID=345309 RepID=A0A7X5TQA7_9GAMM|nr:lipocalin family protein [Luteibacter yeojuensis]NID15875.1 lipocalin family protein [Luteibacter yeojuensis]
MRRLAGILTVIMLAVQPLAGCAAPAPIVPVPHVDVARFMGDWYVIAAIPTRFERHAYRAVESYSLRPDGRVKTTFRYRVDAMDGELKTMHATGFIRENTGNAVWGMQFIWPIKAEYIVAWLDPDYRSVIVARSKRDYVWIMARTPTIPRQEYDRLVERVAAMGYDTRKLRQVPQR